MKALLLCVMIKVAINQLIRVIMLPSSEPIIS